MEHESLIRTEQPQGPSNRSFGLVFSVFFLVIALLPLFMGGHGIRLWSMMAAFVFLAAAFAAPAILAPLNRLWMRLGFLLHKTISPVILGVIFFIVVTPMGILMRLSGKDPLRLRFDSALKSYWIKRDPPGPEPKSMTDQF